jgi:response regulator RpfG family c-di-GMP phosphodiesterase
MTEKTQPINVLLIDDDEAILKMFHIYFGMHQHTNLTTSESCREGIEYFLREPANYDAVITDLNQHPSGVDVVKAVRASENPVIPVYIITGGVTGPKGHILEQAAVDLVGPHRYFVKPLVMKDLCNLVLHEAIEIRKQRYL